MPRLLITTVGTSLLTNRDDRPWAGWNGRAGDQLPDATAIDTWLAQADAIKASAETNTLQAIDVQDSDLLLFLHSDTPEGRFCSERLQHFYANVVKCREVAGRSLTALGYAHASFSQVGLKVLVQEAIKAVNQAREQALEPVFCATGGFKAEIAFLNLLGALLEVEVYYIHEQFRQIVRLPRLPLGWNREWVLQRHRQDFFEWIDEEPRPSAEVESRLKAAPELQPLVEDAGDGYSYLNAAGDLLFRVAKELGPRLPRPATEDEKETPKLGKHNYGQALESILNFLKNLTEGVPYIRYCYSTYWNPDLSQTTRFRLSGETVQGIYSNGTWCVKFHVKTTADDLDPESAAVIVADLNNWLEAV